MERFSARQSRQIDGPPRLLHVHGSFSLGGKEARAVRLMDLWGDRARHSIVSAAPRLMSARDAIDPATPVDFPEAPPLAGRPSMARFRAIAAFLADYDLVLSYNWGAMDAVMADVTDVPGRPVDATDEFVLMGQDGGERISALDLARARTTNTWEVVTGMARRLPRVYHAAAGPVGLRTLTVGRG